ncbi:SusC/RagA family TonB-linked outer membrane protein [Phaeodactylibacter sp.]|uniref:SusC/RagA family TonB-linked outer membrane protein n=1 Tax=Phaeodactylibacter sp. TaxID=1940289 RepID=UPI0025DC2F06|nr:SusC/RagA family TonB-linked outer membrane protein [Phaeodactylibacter sp.]MCI4650154.1 SusC/RagA family TonB-linked outer membrane protein [Phaeodactylibacter sp.]
MSKKLLTTLCFAMLQAFPLVAQQTVTGTVTSDGESLIGVNIIEKGTSNGVLTDLDGNYSIKVGEDATLVFSYTGYETQEVAVGSQTKIDVQLSAGVNLDEVVVTALGIAKDKKALSYSVTEVDPTGFVEAREMNVVNSLSGKVAGVNVATTATGAAGSSRVVIRGNNSLSGGNQPLYVVDGIPIDNTNLGSAGMWGGADGGDGISSINPEDIETISVLKGASASALYGYRSANGVILITTKSGKKRKGIGVEFNTSVRAEQLMNTFDFQREYGHGLNGTAPTTAAQALEQQLYAWGEPLDASRNVMQFDGFERPYGDAGDNIDRFYDTGLSFINTLTLTGGSDMTNFRFSASNLDNSDIMPNSGLTRRNFTMRINSQLSDRLSTVASAMYVYENANNRPRLSDSPGNANYTAWSLPATIDVETLKGDPNKLGAVSPEQADAGLGNVGEELQFNDNIFVTNPYWAAHQFDNDNTKNRLIGKFQMRYEIGGGLYARGQLSLDRFTNRTRNLTPYGTAYSPRGQLSEGMRVQQEINTELLLGYDKDVSENVSLSLFAGGNQQRNLIDITGGSGSNFNIPFLHALPNLQNQSVSFDTEETQVNALFGSAEVGFMRAIYVNGTYRNDWFSTLTSPTGDGEGENNQEYYSAGVSAVLSDLLVLPRSVDFLKLRASYATGSGPGAAATPYQLNLNYGIFGQGHLGQALGGIANGSIPNANLVPLLTKEFEAGIDMRFFTGRLGVDFTYYDRTTEQDIISGAVSPTSGFGSKIVNLGEMSNRGVELMLTGTPIATDKFSWDVTFNYAYNENVVESLLDPENDEETFRADESRTRSAYIEHVEGLPYSQIAGFAYQRDEAGEIVLDDNGLPLQGEFTHFGTGVAPTMIGFGNTFRYKNMSLSFLIDSRLGGKIYSATNSFAYLRGLHQNTLVGRETGIGSVDAANIEDYYGRVAGITEEFIYDGDYAKLRQIMFSYNLPQSVIDRLPSVTGVKFGIAARNLAILWSKTENIDPESTYTVGNAQGLEMFGVPSTRSIQFNLSVRF